MPDGRFRQNIENSRGKGAPTNFFMFKFVPRKAKVTINENKTAMFKVKYIGSVETFVPVGVGCTSTPVQKLWDSCPGPQSLKTVQLIITNKLDIDGLVGNFSTDLRNVSYCAIPRDINSNIFAWIQRNTESHQLKCHAVLCSSESKAKDLYQVMTSAFHAVYKDDKLNFSSTSM